MARGIKTGGRNEGTPNRLTKELREKINDFLNENWEQVEMDFKILEPEKRILLFEKLLQYSLPRMQATELKTIELIPPIKGITFDRSE